MGLANYAKLFQGGDIWIYFKNSMIMWVMGYIQLILVSLILAAWFSNPTLRLKGRRFFKTVIYLTKLIMASAFAMLFLTIIFFGFFFFVLPELPDVVRKYNYSSFGRYDGYRLLAFRGS